MSLSFIPRAGFYVSGVYLCWFNALYFFQYKWGVLRSSLEARCRID